MNNHVPLTRPTDCDAFRGFFPLKSITVDKILKSTSDLEKAISEINILIDSNADFITIEQSNKTFAESLATLEMTLTSILDLIKLQKSSQLRSIAANSSTNTSILSLFYDFIQLAIKVYNQRIFYNPSLFPFIIFFTNLCCYYIEIFQNPNPTLRKDFQNSWSDYYSFSIRLPYFNKEVAIPREFHKFDISFDASEREKIKQVANNKYYDILQLLQVLKREFQDFEKEENINALIKNIIINVKTLRSYFTDMQAFTKEISDHNFINDKLNAINTLLSTLESCASFYKLNEMINQINVLVANDVFILPNNVVQTDYNNWVCFKLAIQAVHMNLKLISLIKFALNNNIDAKVSDCYKLSKMIISSIENSSNESKISDLVSKFIFEMNQLQAINDSSIYENFINFYQEQVNNMTKAMDNTNKDKITLMKNFFENFKSKLKIYDNKKSLSTATNCFNYFSNFEDLFRALIKSIQGDIKIDESLFKIRYYIESSIIYYSNQHLLRHIQVTSGRITKNPLLLYKPIERDRNLKSIWTSLLNSIKTIYPDCCYLKGAAHFLSSFKIFLKVCLVVIDLNEKDKKDKYGEVISFILTYFPQNDVMRTFIPIQKRIDDLRYFVGKIQVNSIKVNEVVFSPAENREIKSSVGNDHADTTLAKFFECEEGIIEISNTLKLLETIRQIIRFFVNYNSFLSTYNLTSTPVERTNDLRFTHEFIECLSHFTDEMIYMLNSPDLRIDITPSFLKEWLGFIRSLIISEDLDRKEIFSRMINDFPFIDYSRLIKKALFNHQKINSMVYRSLRPQKVAQAREIELMSQSIKEKEKKFNEESSSLKMIISDLIINFKFDNSSYNIGNNNLISAILQISSELYQQVQKYWSQLIQIFRFYEKFKMLVKNTHDIRADFDIRKKEFPSSLCQYMNLIMCINLSLNEINKSSYISNDMKMIIHEFNQAINEGRSIFRHLFHDDTKQLEERIYLLFILKMQDLEKILIQADFSQFTNTVRPIFAHFLPLIASVSNDQFYTRCEEVIKDILLLVDSLEDEKIENKFSILYEVKCKVKQFKQYQEPFFVDFYNQLKTAINCELNISFIKSLIPIHSKFLLQITFENQKIISLLSTKSPSFHQIMNLPSICQIPEISQKFDFIINQYCSQKNFKTANDNELSDILSSLASNLVNVKLNAELHVREIISSLRIDSKTLSDAKALIANYMKLKALYESKLDALSQARQESQALKIKQREKLVQLQQTLIQVTQEEFKLKYEFKKLTDIEKMQNDYFKKPALDNLMWAKKIHGTIPKFAEKKKGKPLEVVIRNDLKEGQSSFTNKKPQKVSYSKIIKIEQRFQKTYEKNKLLWEKARTFYDTSNNNININDINNNSKENEIEQKCDAKNEVEIDHEKIGHSSLSNSEISKEFDENVKAVYELFNKANFSQLFLSSVKNNDQDSVNYSNLNSSSSSSFSGYLSSAPPPSVSSAQMSSQSSGNISGNISTSFSGSAFDEEEFLSMIEDINNELFDKAMKFYFINKILERKCVRKTKRKVKVKKSRKPVIKQIIEGEGQK